MDYSTVKEFDFSLLKQDITHVVRAMDNVIDNTIYPLREQEIEAKNKRRMGLGITGFGSLCGLMSLRYGSTESLELLEDIMRILRDTAYETSVALAIEKGPYPLWSGIPEGSFADGLPDHIKEIILKYGLRNSHLLSIAPTGTISLCADNVSSGIEPVFAKSFTRDIKEFDSVRVELVQDYSVARGCTPTTVKEVSLRDHLNVLATASKYVDSACSKTCNVGPKVTWEEFKELYTDAWKLGCSGITTYREREGLEAVLKEVPEEPQEGSMCTWDPETGRRTCDE